MFIAAPLLGGGRVLSIIAIGISTCQHFSEYRSHVVMSIRINLY